MEEVTLTQEQLEALTEGGGHYYTYLTGGEEEEGGEGEGSADPIVVGSADELEQQQQQQILLNQAAEGQEVFVLDQGRDSIHFETVMKMITKVILKMITNYTILKGYRNQLLILMKIICNCVETVSESGFTDLNQILLF